MANGPTNTYRKDIENIAFQLNCFYPGEMLFAGRMLNFQRNKSQRIGERQKRKHCEIEQTQSNCIPMCMTM